jgi:hypothetical protein
VILTDQAAHRHVVRREASRAAVRSLSRFEYLDVFGIVIIIIIIIIIAQFLSFLVVLESIQIFH